jgi:hypothetical protein
MKRITTKRSRSQPSWWHHGEQYCDHCLQAHAVGLEVRCAHCDELCCSDCAVVAVETRVIVCPRCVRELQERH